MHVHTFLEGRPDYFFPLFIANGVTGVRDMGGSLPLERIWQIRREIADGKILSPRFGAVAGRILEGTGGRLDVGVTVATAGEGRRLVQSFKRQGVDFIKVYNLLPRDVYLAIVDEAKKQRLPVAGHTPLSMTAAEVSDLGQKSIEHTADLFTSCSRDEAVLRQELRERAQAVAGGDSNAARMPVEVKAAASYAGYSRKGEDRSRNGPGKVRNRPARLDDDRAGSPGPKAGSPKRQDRARGRHSPEALLFQLSKNLQAGAIVSDSILVRLPGAGRQGKSDH